MAVRVMEFFQKLYLIERWRWSKIKHAQHHQQPANMDTKAGQLGQMGGKEE
jgi:hypothetical protein